MLYDGEASIFKYLYQKNNYKWKASIGLWHRQYFSVHLCVDNGSFYINMYCFKLGVNTFLQNIYMNVMA